MLKLSKDIKLVASDFDGVFTDGSVYIDEDLKQVKKINFSDIMAVSLLLKAGYKFAIISLIILKINLVSKKFIREFAKRVLFLTR